MSQWLFSVLLYALIAVEAYYSLFTPSITHDWVIPPTYSYIIPGSWFPPWQYRTQHERP